MRTFFFLCCLTLSQMASAWGPTGHRVTGALAEHYLSGEARAAIHQILGVETLAEASIWADHMRSSPEEFWQKIASPYHYVTVPPGTTYIPGQAPEEGDAFEAIGKFIATLKSPDASLKDKQLALRFLVHLIGDLHQPLHVGRGDDRGGNDIKLKWFRTDTNLHRVWDSHMIDDEKLSYSEMAKQLKAYISPAKVTKWSDPNALTWINESAQIREGVYPDSDEIGYGYRFQHIRTVKDRLSQAGVRIAAVLNHIFQGKS